MKRIQLFVVLAAFAAFLAVPSSSAFLFCDSCPLDSTPYDRCLAVCNGEVVRYCTDWISSDCADLLYFAPSTHPLDSLFPQPAFLLPATEASYQGACPGAK